MGEGRREVEKNFYELNINASYIVTLCTLINNKSYISCINNHHLFVNIEFDLIAIKSISVSALENETTYNSLIV